MCGPHTVERAPPARQVRTLPPTTVPVPQRIAQYHAPGKYRLCFFEAGLGLGLGLGAGALGYSAEVGRRLMVDGRLMID